MLVIKVFFVLVSTWVSSVQAQTELGLSCSEQPKTVFKMIISSLKEEKRGNWIAKIDIERGGFLSVMERGRSDHWLVEVDSSISSCEGLNTQHFSYTLTAPHPKDKNPEYELFPGLGYYKFHNIPTTWLLARQKCAEEGAHLVIINSDQEADVMKKLFTRYRTIPGSNSADMAFVGLLVRGDDIVTLFGQHLNTTGFQRWRGGSKPKVKDDNVMTVYRDPVELTFGTYLSTWKCAFICEHEL